MTVQRSKRPQTTAPVGNTRQATPSLAETVEAQFKRAGLNAETVETATAKGKNVSLHASLHSPGDVQTLFEKGMNKNANHLMDFVEKGWLAGEQSGQTTIWVSSSRATKAEAAYQLGKIAGDPTRTKAEQNRATSVGKMLLAKFDEYQWAFDAGKNGKAMPKEPAAQSSGLR